ncbi:Gx transporter family protein [uncultured Lactobacillus sp.]|uniref:Gx transporter family protein n=1 Tax=uncultured Lactobacillus sp. TaxID=153152 RepID=UPI0026364201|nr:Gx transporter family protein [uncultured Lactobacillus sp.]
MNKSSRLKEYIYIAILCSQGIILGLIEQTLPPIFAFAPGAKLGLANLITVISLFTLPVSDCILLLYLRLVLTALISGGASLFIYSLAGSTLSFIAMLILKKCYPKFISIIGISIVGAACHNLGQLLVAIWLAQAPSLILYLPVLTIIGIASGSLIGICSQILLNHVQNFNFINTKLH